MNIVLSYAQPVLGGVRSMEQVKGSAGKENLKAWYVFAQNMHNMLREKAKHGMGKTQTTKYCHTLYISRNGLWKLHFYIFVRAGKMSSIASHNDATYQWPRVEGGWSWEGEWGPGYVGTTRPHWPEVPTMPREGLGRTGPSWRLSSAGGGGGVEEKKEKSPKAAHQEPPEARGSSTHWLLLWRLFTVHLLAPYS